jgi:hypothetical protein
MTLSILINEFISNWKHLTYFTNSPCEIFAGAGTIFEVRNNTRRGNYHAELPYPQ